MEEVNLITVNDWWLARSGGLVWVTGLMLMPFSEIRNLGVRAALKREDDDRGLGCVGFEVPVVIHMEMSSRQLVIWAQQHSEERAGLQVNWQLPRRRW